MSYLRIENFWNYQNADAWKKARAAKRAEFRHPTWCKLTVRRDYDLDRLDIPTRLLFFELLRLATEHSNAIVNDSEWIAKQISMPVESVVNGLAELRKGAWIRETATNRPSRELLETFSPKKEKEKEKRSSRSVDTEPPTPIPPEALDFLNKLSATPILKDIA